MSVRTVPSMRRIAALCRSLTPSPELASAAISRRTRYARSSHTTELFHCLVAEAFPEFWDRLSQVENPNVAAMTHQVQHTLAGEGLELNLPDAVITVKIDAEHTDNQFELFEVDAPRGP